VPKGMELPVKQLKEGFGWPSEKFQERKKKIFVKTEMMATHCANESCTVHSDGSKLVKTRVIDVK
jgi:hypothetical protein